MLFQAVTFYLNVSFKLYLLYLCLRLENFPMPFVIRGLALLLDLILNLVFGKQSS